MGFCDGFTHQVRDPIYDGIPFFLKFKYCCVFFKRCRAVKRTTLAWLVSSTWFAERFAQVIGRHCRKLSIVRMAKFNRLSSVPVRRMEKNYMLALLAKHPPAENLSTIAVDEAPSRRPIPKQWSSPT
jgi:hypothetical protein